MSLRQRALPSLLALAPVVLAATACGFEVDTPLGATAEQRGTVIGEPVTGTVQFPDGTITVTLAPADLPQPASGSNSSGRRVTACDYDSESHDFACPTEGREAGMYRVEVTDAAFESEGTHLVSVALTDDPDYQPRVRPTGGDDVLLLGWMPGSEVTVFVRNLERGTTRRVGTVTTDAGGSSALTLDRPLGARAWVLASDGLWDDRSVDGWDYGT